MQNTEHSAWPFMTIQWVSYCSYYFDNEVNINTGETILSSESLCVGFQCC